MFRIKICGITRAEDARLAAQAQAEAIGLNFYRRSKRCVTPETARRIAAAVGSGVAKVGVFVNESTDRIQSLAAEIPLDYIQLHGDEPVEQLAELADLRVIKAFRSRDGGLQAAVDCLNACRATQRPRAVLIDAYAPGDYGGTGKTLDWTTLGQDAQLPHDVPLLLAGGLTPENVADAIRLARPFGVDVASGVESSPGVKDAEKVNAFVAGARRALND